MAVRTVEDRRQQRTLTALIALRRDFETASMTYCRIIKSREYMKDASARTMNAAIEAEAEMLRLFDRLESLK